MAGQTDVRADRLVQRSIQLLFDRLDLSAEIEVDLVM